MRQDREPVPERAVLDMMLGPMRWGRISLPSDYSLRDLEIIRMWLEIAKTALALPPLDDDEGEGAECGRDTGGATSEDHD